MKYSHPCPRWEGCSSSYCPLTKEGSYNRHDALCSRLPVAFTREATKDLKGAGSAEATRIINNVFDKTLKKAASSAAILGGQST